MQLVKGMLIFYDCVVILKFQKNFLCRPKYAPQSDEEGEYEEYEDESSQEAKASTSQQQVQSKTTSKIQLNLDGIPF